MTAYIERMKKEIQEVVTEMTVMVNSKKDLPAQFKDDFENFINKWSPLPSYDSCG